MRTGSRTVAIMFAFVLLASPALADRFVLVSSWASKDVRRYTLSGALVDTFIPAGSGGLDLPDGLTVGPDGDVYVADANHARILRYDGQTGAFKNIFANTGITRAGYCQFGPDGNLYVCSAGDNQVHRYGPTGDDLGQFTAPGSTLAFPAGLAWKDNILFVSGFNSGRVYKFDATTGALLGNLAATFSSALYVRADPNGDLYISEFRANRVDRYNTTTNIITGRYGTTAGGGAAVLNGPVGQLLLPSGELLVTSWSDGRVVRMNKSTGAVLGNFLTGYPQANDLALTADIPAPAAPATLLLAATVGARRRRSRP